jgi:hypothetical protein
VDDGAGGVVTGIKSVSGTAVNDAPTATNLTQSLGVAEDVATKLFTAAPVVSDVDSANVTATLTLSNTAAGALTTATSGAVTSAYNAGTGVWTASGAIASVNALLAAVTFAPAADFNGTASVAVAVSDGQNGPQGANPSGTISITVTAVNDAPIATADSLSSVAEDSGQRTISFATLTGNDHPGPATATDEAGQTLTITAVNNAVGGTVSISGGNVLFTPNANFNGTAGFDYTVTDNGTTNGNSDPKSASAHVSFAVTAANDPVHVGAPASLAVNENQSATVGGLSISDVDTTLAPGGVYEVSLSAAHGTLSLSSTAGLSFTAGDGTADAAMTFHGTLSAINAALATASYAGNIAFNGTDSIAFSATDTFGGVVATGSGAATSDHAAIAVTISPSGQLQTDFNADGMSDLLWQTNGGQLAIWEMNGIHISAADYTRVASSAVGLPGPDWHIVDTGDFNGDGKADILWRTDGGASAIWEMDGTHILAADYTRQGSLAVGAPGPDWHNLGAADFNGDGKSDLLWRTDSGALAIWQMDGTHIPTANYITNGGVAVGAPGPDWHIVGTGDFDGDGKADILWETDNHALAVWEMNGSQIKSASYLTHAGGNVGAPGADWHVSDIGDFDGDGKADILWRIGPSASTGSSSTGSSGVLTSTTGNALPPGGGTVAIWEMDGFQVKDAAYTTQGSLVVGAPGPDWHLLGAEDYNGDGKSDLLWETDSGALAVWQMDGTQIATAGYTQQGPNTVGAPGADWHVFLHHYDLV